MRTTLMAAIGIIAAIILAVVHLTVAGLAFDAQQPLVAAWAVIATLVYARLAVWFFGPLRVS